ncbi:MAG TPA: serine/threonine-protein kinase [Polyangia bacterium]|jgi:serine/threonine-protein kinase|nr:serine/threonine-protein kinase [Polyangia bacterium]
MRLCSCSAECDDEAEACPSCGATLGEQADRSRSYATGEVVGSYRLLEQIGQGGMGNVFVAEHIKLGRRVALKMLRSEFSHNTEAVRRFFAEARAVNRINHENIIEVSDFIESTRGRSYYIMELLGGVDLRTLEEQVGALPIGRALGIVIQVCRGLGAAHDAGIVHRDLKPDNIFLTERNGRGDFVKLLDFGVAKLMDDALDGVTNVRTTAGVVVGTPEYMSPEQASGDPADHRSDIYSVGVILFEMVTGQRPFDAPSAREIMVQHVMAAPPRPSKLQRFGAGVPAALEELILDCLKKRPQDRPQSMMEVEQRLETIARRLSVTVMTPPADRPPVAVPARRWLWGAAGAASAIMLGLAVVQVVGAHGPSLASARAQPAPSSAKVATSAAAAGTARPARQVRVRLSFDTLPAGAIVSRVGDERPLGATPFSALFDASPAAQTFEFSKDGWRVERRQVALGSDTRLAITLRPVETASAAPPAPPALPAPPARKAVARNREPAPGSGARPPVFNTLDHSAVLNPFE